MLTAFMAIGNHPEAAAEAGLACVYLTLAAMARRQRGHLVAYILAASFAATLAACAVAPHNVAGRPGYKTPVMHSCLTQQKCCVDMPLPEFDTSGNLPPGEHVASWQEFEARFGYNAGRAAILRQIEAWLLHMQRAGCRAVYIDGSFVCRTENPGDYDACWDATGVDAALIDPALLVQTMQGRQAIKRRFGGDIRPDMVCPPGTILTYLRFFQKDRDGNAKGIVRINLRDFSL